MTIKHAFGMTFALAVALETLQWFVLVPVVVHITFWTGYVILIVLGFMLGRTPHPYRTAFANTWPFVLLWFLVGCIGISMRHGNYPPDWTEEKSRLAFGGWTIATILHLPLAFGASTLGVWLGRVYLRRKNGQSNAT